jgi:hypothetical protein
MKQQKQRVIAIDYLRGLLILMVVVNHGAAFTKPFSYLTGDGGLWTSAAELFLILSGLTFAIVRGPQVLSDFRGVLKKTLRRSFIIYTAYISVVFISLLLALTLSARGLPNDVSGPLPVKSGISLILSILSFSYSLGWASFLMYFSIFLIFAPFAMYLLRTHWWYILPAFSAGLFVATRGRAATDIYASFGVWQIYFAMGLMIGRFKQTIKQFNDTAKLELGTYVKTAIVGATTLMITVSVLLNFSIYPTVTHLTAAGWMPLKIQAAYIHLRNLKPALDSLFMDGRTGWLRPLLALMAFVSVWLIYHKYQNYILKKSGRLFITMGQRTLAIFIAQAIIIPLIYTIGLPPSFASSLLLTGLLILAVWVVARTKFSMEAFRLYFSAWRNSFYEAKYSYLYRSESDS